MGSARHASRASTGVVAGSETWCEQCRRAYDAVYHERIKPRRASPRNDGGTKKSSPGTRAFESSTPCADCGRAFRSGGDEPGDQSCRSSKARRCQLPSAKAEPGAHHRGDQSASSVRGCHAYTFIHAKAGRSSSLVQKRRVSGTRRRPVRIRPVPTDTLRNRSGLARFRAKSASGDRDADLRARVVGQSLEGLAACSAVGRRSIGTCSVPGR